MKLCHGWTSAGKGGEDLEGNVVHFQGGKRRREALEDCCGGDLVWRTALGGQAFEEDRPE
ncbi:hypothetical protein HDV00_011774, partial [Rhizophlyctis rosea]